MYNRKYVNNFNTSKSKGNRLLNFFVNLILTAIILTSLMFLAFSYIYISTQVIGSSMQPTLNYPHEHQIDTVYINKFARYKHGDIIVVKQPGNSVEYIIKRVIAMEGDTVDIVANLITPTQYEYKLLLNGNVLNESAYLAEDNISLPVDNTGMEKTYTLFTNFKQDNPDWLNEDGALVVPSKYVFILGDNRGVSADSSSYGPYPIKDVVGKVDYIIPYGTSELEFFINRFLPFTTKS